MRPFTVGRGLAVLTLILALALQVWDPAPIESLRLAAFDAFQWLRPRVRDSRPVVVVDLDEESLAAVGQWPWPRTKIAELLRALFKAGMTVVGFDVVFPEPDRLSPQTLAGALRPDDPTLAAEVAALPSNDDVLAATFREGLVVVGQAGYQRSVGRAEGKPKQVGIAMLGGDPLPWLTRFPGLVRNLPELEDAAAGWGLFSINTERDGRVRRLPALVGVDGTLVPTLSLELLRVASGGTTYAIGVDDSGIERVLIQPVAEIPTDRHGRLWVHFAPHDPSIYVSARDVLDGTVDPALLDGRIGIIGSSAVGLQDLLTTPLGETLPGVEAHVQLIETVVDGTQLRRPAYLGGGELLLTLGLGFLAIVLVPLAGPIMTLLFGGVVGALVCALSWYLYVQHRLLMDVTVPLLGSMAVYTVLTYANYSREAAERRRVRGAFSRYLSPALVEQLATNRARLVLGGETKEMTFLFSDVRGFTRVAERYREDPQLLTGLINRLLTPLTDAILARRGTIDKYMGDCVMAFWNAPLDDDAHATHACEAALAILDEIEGVNEALRQEARDRPLDPLRMGIGINTGRCVVGNMGSAQRFDYSVLGDAVNLASRLEGQSKTYGVSIVLGERTAEAVENTFALLELDRIAVQGKTEAVRIFCLLGDGAVRASDEFRGLASAHAEMLAAYRTQRWEEARASLLRCREHSDGRLTELYSLYESRIEAFRTSPPGPEWDGVYAATTK